MLHGGLHISRRPSICQDSADRESFDQLYFDSHGYHRPVTANGRFVLPVRAGGLYSEGWMFVATAVGTIIVAATIRSRMRMAISSTRDGRRFPNGTAYVHELMNYYYHYWYQSNSSESRSLPHTKSVRCTTSRALDVSKSAHRYVSHYRMPRGPWPRIGNYNRSTCCMSRNHLAPLHRFRHPQLLENS